MVLVMIKGGGVFGWALCSINRLKRYIYSLLKTSRIKQQQELPAGPQSFTAMSKGISIKVFLN